MITSKGFGIKINGYNDKIQLLLDVVLKSLKNVLDEVDESVFEAQKNDLKDGFKNSIQSVNSLAKNVFTKVLTNDFWMDTESYEEIDRISFDNLQKFVTKLFRQMKIQVLVQGNVTKLQAEEVAAKLASNLACESIDYVSKLLIVIEIICSSIYI